MPALTRVLPIVAALLLARAAHADSAVQLFEQGRTLAKQGRYAEACDKFARSYDLDPGAGTLLNLADCQEHVGHLAAAWRMFDEVARDAEKTGNADRAKFARRRSDALVPRLGKVAVHLDAPARPGLAVTIGGHAVPPAADIAEYVDPGSVEVRVVAATGTFARAAQVEAGATVTFDVPEKPPAEQPAGRGPTAPAVAPVPRTATTTERRHSRVVMSYALGGVGIAGFATGVALGVKARSDYDHQFSSGACTAGSPPVCMTSAAVKAATDAGHLADLGTGVAIGGLALVTAGVIVFVTAPKDVVVAPIATTTTAGLTLSARF